jgi:hypothetical protein
MKQQKKNLLRSDTSMFQIKRVFSNLYTTDEEELTGSTMAIASKNGPNLESASVLSLTFQTLFQIWNILHHNTRLVQTHRYTLNTLMRI